MAAFKGRLQINWRGGGSKILHPSQELDWLLANVQQISILLVQRLATVGSNL
jgi:hypothetical protein